MTKIVNISGAEITDTGIQRLMEYCRDTLTDDYTLIIGCLPYNSDIDAILIGNGNIYAVECKHWKGEIEGSTYGHWTKDGETISNPLHQTRNNTVALARWLREKTGLNGSLWVRGLLVFTHDHCQIHITRDNGSNNGVEVILLGDLKGYLERQERTVREEVVCRVVGLFEGIENIDHIYKKEAKDMERHEDETGHATYSYIKAIEDGDMKDIKKGHKFFIKKIVRLLVMLLSAVAVGYFAIKGKLDYALCAGLFLLLQFRPVIGYIRRFTLDTVTGRIIYAVVVLGSMIAGFMTNSLVFLAIAVLLGVMPGIMIIFHPYFDDIDVGPSAEEFFIFFAQENSE